MGSRPYEAGLGKKCATWVGVGVRSANRKTATTAIGAPSEERLRGPTCPVLRGRICKRSVPRRPAARFFSVPRGPAREHQRRVRFPGVYRIRRGETLSDLVVRAGGLTEGAFADGAVFLREELREREKDRTAELRSITNQLYGDLLRGDPERFDSSIHRAEQLKAAENQLTFFKGLHELLKYSPDLEEAHRHFTSILESDPENIPARAMLAHTISHQGDEIGYLHALNEIEVAKADQFDEELFLGYASQWGRPQQAYELLKRANDAEPYEPFVDLQLGAATRLYAVSVVTDLEDAEKLLTFASDNINSAAQSMPSTPMETISLFRRTFMR